MRCTVGTRLRRTVRWIASRGNRARSEARGDRGRTHRDVGDGRDGDAANARRGRVSEARRRRRNEHRLAGRPWIAGRRERCERRRDRGGPGLERARARSGVVRNEEHEPARTRWKRTARTDIRCRRQPHAPLPTIPSRAGRARVGSFRERGRPGSVRPSRRRRAPSRRSGETRLRGAVVDLLGARDRRRRIGRARDRALR